MKIFWNGTYVYTFVKYKCGRLYSTFPLVRSLADAIVSQKPETSNSYPDYPWASITQLIEESSGKLRILEVNFDLTEFEWQYKTMSENLLRLNNMCKNLLLNNTTVIECLLLFSDNENTIHSRVINRENVDVDIELNTNGETNVVNIKFLLTNYVHDELNEPYELVVDKNYFIEGNQILSGAFVGKLLHNQGYTGAFDKTYRVLIIDHEVKMFEWTYTQFIEFTKNKKYTIKASDIHETTEETNTQKQETENNCVTNVDEDDTPSWDKVDKE